MPKALIDNEARVLRERSENFRLNSQKSKRGHFMLAPRP